MNASPTQEGERASVDGDILGRASRRRRSRAGRVEPAADVRSTFPATTTVPSSIRLEVSGDRMAAVRRTFGTVSIRRR
jgi:hypothetical protein